MLNNASEIGDTQKVAKILEFLQRVSLKEQPDYKNTFVIEAIFRLGAEFNWNVDEAVKFYEESYSPGDLILQDSDPKALIKEFTPYFGFLDKEHLEKVQRALGFEDIDVSDLEVKLNEIEFPQP